MTDLFILIGSTNHEAFDLDPQPDISLKTWPSQSSIDKQILHHSRTDEDEEVIEGEDKT
jgi:hypothetical protein